MVKQTVQKGGAKGKAVGDSEGYFDHIHVDGATVKELTRRLVWANLTGTEEGQAGIPGGHGAQATDLILLAWAMADASDRDERDDILEAVKEAAADEDVGETWRAVADAALDRLSLIRAATSGRAERRPAPEVSGPVDLADTARGVFVDVSEQPSISEVKGRMAALFDVAGDGDGEALFLLFDELHTLYRKWPDETGAWLEIAREAAFVCTSKFRAALDGN